MVMKSLTQNEMTGANLSRKSLEDICSWLAFLLNCVDSLRLSSTCVIRVTPGPILTSLNDERLLIKRPPEKVLVKCLD